MEKTRWCGEVCAHHILISAYTIQGAVGSVASQLLHSPGFPACCAINSWASFVAISAVCSARCNLSRISSNSSFLRLPVIAPHAAAAMTTRASAANVFEYQRYSIILLRQRKQNQCLLVRSCQGNHFILAHEEPLTPHLSLVCESTRVCILPSSWRKVVRSQKVATTHVTRHNLANLLGKWFLYGYTDSPSGPPVGS